MVDDPLLERLKALGVKTDQLSNRRQASHLQIGDVVPGEIQKTLYGEIFTADTLHPITSNYGVVSFAQALDIELMSAWSGIPLLKSIPLHDICFVDAETTSLSGGVGTFAFMVGVGYLDNEGFKLRQFFLRDPSEEPAMLAAMSEFVTPFKVVTTFNGKTFDLPLLAGRYTLNAITNPFKGLPHIDLLQLARNIWRFRLQSRALKDLETDILFITRSEIEIPGWLVPQMYFDYLRTGDPSPMKGVFYHNRMDIISLGALYFYTSQLLTNPDQNTNASLDIMAIARLYERIGQLEGAIHLYDKCLDLGLPINHYFDTCQRYASIYKKRGDWSAAVAIWQKAGILGSVSALIELAKYYEHIEKDNAKAISSVEAVIDVLLQDGKQVSDYPEILTRYQRLINKRIKT